MKNKKSSKKVYLYIAFIDPLTVVVARNVFSLSIVYTRNIYHTSWF